MQVELWLISRVKPYENNPRLNDDAVDALAASIREFGFRQPIVVDASGVIICGHTRYKAAHKLGLDKVPVHVANDLTPDQIRAYRIADNKTAEGAKWDFDLLPIELGALKASDYDLGILGFDPDELAQLLDPGTSDGLTDPDDIPSPPDEATTRPGDLWLLGEHRLLCGDSSKPDDLDLLLDGQPIHLVNTDPPYNVKVEPRSNNAIAAGLSSFEATHHQKMDVNRHPSKSKPTGKKLRAKDRPLANDFVSAEDFDQLLDAWFGNMARVLLPGHGFYVWGGYANLGNYPPFLKKHGLYFSQGIVWDKQHPVLTRKDFMGAFEICFYGWLEGAAHRYFGPNNATDLWHVKKVNPQSMIHLTEKPVELAARAMQYSSHAGENVLDLFGGSGSTLIAAQLPMQLPMIFLSRVRDLDHAPHLGLARMVTQEHADQFGGIQVIALGAPLAPIDLDRSRIDDDVDDPLACQPAMQPEAVAAGFVTAHDLGLLGQAETPLGAGDFLEQLRQVTCANRA